MSVKVVLGCMEFGRYADEPTSVAMTEKFIAAGNIELDTAIMYAHGEAEKIMGRFSVDIKSKTLVHTKVNPWYKSEIPCGLTPESIVNQATISMQSLQVKPNVSDPPIDILYLHAPDHNTPIETSLRAMQELFKQGVFRRLGLSNYASWQVMQAFNICHHNGWVLPSVYQGMYNAITRSIEAELLPCLRELKMSLYIYNPLAGGLLSGKYKFDQEPTEPGRFSGNDWAEAYRARFWKKKNFEAIDFIQSVLKEIYGSEVSLTQASLRWVMHHSVLKSQFGDAVILGASKMHHLEENISACAAGPLDAKVVAAFQSAWEATKSDSPVYYR